MYVNTDALSVSIFFVGGFTEYPWILTSFVGLSIDKLLCMIYLWFFSPFGDMLSSRIDRQSGPEDFVVLEIWSCAQSAGRHPELSSCC